MIISRKHLSVFLAFLLISITSAYFGKWFALQQLFAVSTSTAALDSYPKIFFYITAAKCFVTLAVIFGFAYLISVNLSGRRVSLLWVAISFLPILLVGDHVSLKFIATSVFGLLTLGLLCVWRRRDYLAFAKNHGTDVIALFVLFIMHLFFTSEFSPLHLNKALYTMASEEIPVEAPIYKGYSLAKQYAFSTFDYSEWGAVINPPITLASPLSQLFTLTLDLPSIDPVTFHKIILMLGFLLIVGGSFGSFLFLKYACKVNSLMAWFGGCLMFFSVDPYLWFMINADGAIFLSTYATLPYCLLALSLACEKYSYKIAAWAGIAMASPFFLFSPHPEGVIYTALCAAMYGLGLLLFSPFGKVGQRFIYNTIGFMGFAILSAYVIIPMFIDQWGGNMYTFAHTSDVEANLPLIENYLTIFKVFVPISMLLLLLRRNMYPAYAPTLFFCLTFNLLYFATTYLGFVKLLVNTLHIGIHIWAPCRIQLFAVLSLIYVFIMGLDGCTRVTWNIVLHIISRLPQRYIDQMKFLSFLLFKAKDRQNEQA